MSKTRNQRQRVRDKALAGVTVAMAVVAGVLLARALEHPAEQPISGSEHMAEIAQYAPEKQTVIEAKALPVVESIPEPVEEPKLYDVPLGKELQLHIIETCEAYDVDPVIVLAMIWRESRFHADSVGDGGNSLGLMQVQPRWHSGRMKKLGCEDLLDPYQNVVVGIDYLAESVDRYDGDVAKALVAYNAGHYNGTITEYAKSVLEKADEMRGTYK